MPRSTKRGERILQAVRESYITCMSEPEKQPRNRLSEFQTTKLSFYFSIIDIDKDGVITLPDIDAYSEKMLKYAQTPEDADLYDLTFDINESFFESMCTRLDRKDLRLSDWLDVWADEMKGCAAINDFPYWIQTHCKLYFEIMDKDRDGHLNREELSDYYTRFVGVDPRYAQEQAEKGYNAMTGSGQYLLNMDNFLMNFANFLLGKDVYGPGEYVFAVFDIGRPKASFKVVYPAEALGMIKEGVVFPRGRLSLKAAADAVIIARRMAQNQNLKLAPGLGSGVTIADSTALPRAPNKYRVKRKSIY